ncbi:MAG: tRNA methyltransferase [Calditrichaeota bacterium]|nr:RNA methyltransferase [Calditrichota bacterium]RQV93513.1 MAG: tRNA methyltransferase [bacterium]RQW06427.1 MAG: tRNA methyltransferase [Calditrichota bacterium]
MPTEKRLAKIKKVLQARQTDLTVVCENIHDPHNVSAICRSCDAVGVSDVYLLYTNEPFPRLGRKSSASAKKWLEFHRYKSHTDLQKFLHSLNMRIYAACTEPSSKSIYEIDWRHPSAIIMGNEHRGVSKAGLKIADQTIYIPMVGMVESLNVSVATAVILYEAFRQRQGAGKYKQVCDKNWFDRHFRKWTDPEL